MERARIIRHGRPSAEISERDIEARAQELALINERVQPTEEDFAQAREELGRGMMSDALSQDSGDEEVDPVSSRDPSDPPPSPAGHRPKVPADDEELLAEQEAREGVDEAHHDVALEARRRRDRD